MTNLVFWTRSRKAARHSSCSLSLEVLEGKLLLSGDLGTADAVAPPAAAISVASLGNLRALSPSTATVVNVLGYAAVGDGGGGTFRWNPSDTTSADDAGTILKSSVLGASGRWDREFSGPLDVRWFGARGDGVTDDTDALQRALSAAGSPVSGSSVVDAAPGATYLVSFRGNKQIAQGGGLFNQRYCLQIMSNTTLDLEGSTLRLADGQNASILINQHPYFGDVNDTNITVANGTFDGNRKGQTYPAQGSMSCLFLSNCTNVTNTDLAFNNVRDVALYWQKISNSFADGLSCSWSDGDGFFFGFFSPTSVYDARVYNSHVGTIVANNCHNNTYIVGSFIRQGNPVLINAVNSTFDLMQSTNCGGGFKVSEGSLNVTVGEADFTGTPRAQADSTNATNNSGFKIQGNGVGADPQGIVVNKVVSTGCAGSGLYIENAWNSYVTSYSGSTNGWIGNPDVWLGTGSGNAIAQVSSSYAAGEAVLVRSGASNYGIGQMVIADPCQVYANGAGVDIQGISGTIKSVSVSNKTGQMRYGLAVFNTSSQGSVGQVNVLGACSAPMSIRSQGFTVGTN